MIASKKHITTQFFLWLFLLIIENFVKIAFLCICVIYLRLVLNPAKTKLFVGSFPGIWNQKHKKKLHIFVFTVLLWLYKCFFCTSLVDFDRFWPTKCWFWMIFRPPTIKNHNFTHTRTPLPLTDAFHDFSWFFMIFR